MGLPVDLVIDAARAVVDGVERPARVVVDGGLVVAVLPGAGAAPPAREHVVLGDDEVLVPGLVDTHVHVNEPGRTPWEGFATATRAAALGGVTTIVDMPLNSVPPTVDPAALRLKREAASGQAAVDVGFWGGAVPASLGRLAPLHEAGVYGFKAFLVDSGVPEFPPLDGAQLADALAEVAALGSVLLVHAEDPAVLDAAPPAAGRRFADFVASRPAAAEAAAVERLLEAAREAAASGPAPRVHVLHVAGADALPLLAAARADGLAVSAETCPHYLGLRAEDVPDGATQFKCCPPIREGAHRERLWAALADGTLDIVVTDHSPCTPDLKRLDTGDFATAWGGIASLQLGLAVTWTAARARGLALADVVGWMATAPARLFGLTGKGRIAAGSAADLAVVAPQECFVVDPARLAHRNPVTPYAGRELYGTVRRTWLAGADVPAGGPPGGRLLSRGAATGTVTGTVTGTGTGATRDAA